MRCGLLVILVSAAALAQHSGARRDATTFHGVLVDAGCMDRNPENLAQPPPAAAKPPAKSSKAERKARPQHGVSVNRDTLNKEQADVLRHQEPDLYARQNDVGCAVTAGTKAFALLLSDGHLLNLDEGGNTKAFEAVQSSPRGRQMLNGRSPGEKPRATLQGRRRADQLVVDWIRLD